VNQISVVPDPATLKYVFVSYFPFSLTPQSDLDKLITASSHEPYYERRIRMLVLRGVDDEASLALSLGAVTTRVSRLISNIIFYPFALVVMYAVPLLISFASMRVDPELGPHILGVNLTTVGTLVSVYLTITLASMSWLTSLGMSSFGRELFARGVLCEINSASVPDNDGTVDTFTLSPHRFDFHPGLRHALYNRFQCPEVIAEWIASGLVNRKVISRLV
jgi:hypothetical protein